MVAIDLDGTLLTDAKQVSEHTVKALCGLPQRQVKVVIASARPPRAVRHIYQLLKLDTLQVNYNGALIWDEPGRRAAYHRPMDGALVLRVIEHARDFYEEVLVSCEILDRWYTDRFEDKYVTETGRLFKPDVIAPLPNFCVRPITKLLLLGEKVMIDRLEKVLTETYGGQISVVRTDPELLQLMDHGASKADALTRVAQFYGLDMKEVMAIGDAPNDVEMLQAAGVAIAMDNAHRLVKKAAHWVAPSNNDHGVHAALMKYGLCD